MQWWWNGLVGALQSYSEKVLEAGAQARVAHVLAYHFSRLFQKLFTLSGKYLKDTVGSLF